MNIDLSEFTFVPELVHPCRWNGTELEFGCVFSHGRELAQSNAPAGRGLREPFTVYLRAADTALAGQFPAVGDLLEITTENALTAFCRILNVRPAQGGCIALDCEQRGSRAVATNKK